MNPDSPAPGFQIPDDARMIRPDVAEFVKPKFLAAGSWNALSSALSLVVPFAVVRIIDDGIAASDVRALVIWTAAAASAQIFAGLSRYRGRCRVASCALDAEKQRLRSLFNKTMNADLRSFPDLAQGGVMGQIIFASGAERHFIDIAYTQGVSLAVSGIGTVAALLALSWQLALVSLIIFPAAAVLWIWMKRRVAPAVRRSYESRESIYRRIVDVFRAVIPIRALHQQDRFSEQFDRACSDVRDAELDLEKKQSVQGPFFDVFQAVMLIAVFGAGGYGVMHDVVSVGELLGFQLYLTRLFALMRSGTGIFGAWQQYIEGRARAFDVENLPPSPSVHFSSASDGEALRLTDVSFAFGSHVIWDHQSLCIKKGQNEALLLPSGAGKTTLARCILGLYPISGGSIAIPGADPRNIGFVPQENVLFDGTLRDNVEIMHGTVEDPKYASLLDICCLKELDERLGAQSIGDCGARLSGGEQRRVMLARALATGPQLLVIDQMASELEPELCRTIFSRIRQAYPQIGIFYLGHRMPEWDGD